MWPFTSIHCFLHYNVIITSMLILSILHVVVLPSISTFLFSYTSANAMLRSLWASLSPKLCSSLLSLPSNKIWCLLCLRHHTAIVFLLVSHSYHCFSVFTTASSNILSPNNFSIQLYLVAPPCTGCTSWFLPLSIHSISCLYHLWWGFRCQPMTLCTNPHLVGDLAFDFPPAVSPLPLPWVLLHSTSSCMTK